MILNKLRINYGSLLLARYPHRCYVLLVLPVGEVYREVVWLLRMAIQRDE